ncbi:MAG: DUF6498-containing protein [Opitutus sp.]
MQSSTTGPNRWSGAWLDAVAFSIGLGLAWWLRWEVTDLVWSLWLSSLVIGYALILWILSEPLRELCAGIAADRNSPGAVVAKVVTVSLLCVGTLFGIAFFTVHFGGFHFGHSIFLRNFFPVGPQRSGGGLIDWATYGEVASRYWIFLPAAFLAERHAFRWTYRKTDEAVTPAAIAHRKEKGNVLMLPYRGIIRMHLLIFFFAGAHAAKLDGFLVYAVVYAVYFFPWRVLRREKVTQDASVAA